MDSPSPALKLYSLEDPEDPKILHLSDFRRPEERVDAPAGLEFSMPAEWTSHLATWISWPNADSETYFSDCMDSVVPVFLEMVRTLADGERVHINISHVTEERMIERALGPGQIENVVFFDVKTDEPWVRDHGPTFVSNSSGLVAGVCWGYNAWGGKYLPADRDVEASNRMCEALHYPVIESELTMEGGAIDSNGAGALLASSGSILNDNRNPGLTKERANAIFKETLGADQVIWLDAELAGDDTDGHVDTYSRFVDENTIVTAIEEDEDDINYAPLRENYMRLKGARTLDGKPYRVIGLPMPPAIHIRGERMPATYANFYVGNQVVLMPAYQCAEDIRARAILQNVFPDRKIVPIDSRPVIWGRGSFHCLTQPVPASPSPKLDGFSKRGGLVA